MIKRMLKNDFSYIFRGVVKRLDQQRDQKTHQQTDPNVKKYPYLNIRGPGLYYIYHNLSTSKDQEPIYYSQKASFSNKKCFLEEKQQDEETDNDPHQNDQQSQQNQSQQDQSQQLQNNKQIDQNEANQKKVQSKKNNNILNQEDGNKSHSFKNVKELKDLLQSNFFKKYPGTVPTIYLKWILQEYAIVFNSDEISNNVAQGQTKNSSLSDSILASLKKLFSSIQTFYNKHPQLYFSRQLISIFIKDKMNDHIRNSLKNITSIQNLNDVLLNLLQQYHFWAKNYFKIKIWRIINIELFDSGQKMQYYYKQKVKSWILFQIYVCLKKYYREKISYVNLSNDDLKNTQNDNYDFTNQKQKQIQQQRQPELMSYQLYEQPLQFDIGHYKTIWEYYKLDSNLQSFNQKERKRKDPIPSENFITHLKNQHIKLNISPKLLFQILHKNLQRITFNIACTDNLRYLYFFKQNFEYYHIHNVTSSLKSYLFNLAFDLAHCFKSITIYHFGYIKFRQQKYRSNALPAYKYLQKIKRYGTSQKIWNPVQQSFKPFYIKKQKQRQNTFISRIEAQLIKNIDKKKIISFDLVPHYEQKQNKQTIYVSDIERIRVTCNSQQSHGVIHVNLYQRIKPSSKIRKPQQKINNFLATVQSFYDCNKIIYTHNRKKYSILLHYNLIVPQIYNINNYLTVYLNDKNLRNKYIFIQKQTTDPIPTKLDVFKRNGDFLLRSIRTISLSEQIEVVVHKDGDIFKKKYFQKKYLPEIENNIMIKVISKQKEKNKLISN